MKVSYNWLKEFVPKLPTPEKTAELLSLHAFEVEGMEKKEKDTVLDVAVLPNRAHDCLSHQGIAWELAAIGNLSFKRKQANVEENKAKNIKDYLKVEVRDRKSCPRYTSRVILEVTVKPSPKWLRDRLAVLGQNSINNLVDAANYVMLMLGQPLHVFDLDKIEGKTLIVRKAKKGERIVTLDGNRVSLDPSDLIIADRSQALAIAGIKGGKKAEVTERTKNIALESAHFDPMGIRRTSRRIGVRTEASWRFENGTPPALCSAALDTLASLIVRVAGGEVAAGARDTKAREDPPRIIGWNPDRVRGLLGADISDKEMADILKRLGFEIRTGKNTHLARVPWWRLDMEGEADIAEEIGRLWGYMNIPSWLPSSVLITPKQNTEAALAEKMRNGFSYLGFSETYNRSFIGNRHVDWLPRAYPNLAPIANPLSDEQKYLRPTLLFSLLENVRENLKHVKSVRLFEIGNIFSLSGKKRIDERLMCAGVIAQRKESTRAELFFEAKGAVDGILERLGVDEVWYDDARPTSDYSDQRVWHKGRVAEIKVQNKEIGTMGELSPAFAAEAGVDVRVAAFEIALEPLFALVTEKAEYRPVSKYPAVERDISVLVPREVKIDTVQEIIERAGGRLLSDSDLFDIYEGEHLEAEQKSLAFHLVFQSPERTLTDKELTAVFAKIVKALETEGWEVRK